MLLRFWKLEKNRTCWVIVEEKGPKVKWTELLRKLRIYSIYFRNKPFLLLGRKAQFFIPYKPKIYLGIFCLLWVTKVLFIPLKKYFYLFVERGRRREKKRERNINVWEIISCLLQAPNWGPGLQPRCVPWLGIKPVTFQFTGLSSIHWATPARAIYTI